MEYFTSALYDHWNFIGQIMLHFGPVKAIGYLI